MARRRRRAALIAVLVGIALLLGLATGLRPDTRQRSSRRAHLSDVDEAPAKPAVTDTQASRHPRPWCTARKLTGSVFDGTVSEQTVTIARGTEHLGVSLNWQASDANEENYLALELVAPDGVATYAPDFSRAEAHWDLTVQRPASGDWTVRVIGSSVSGEQDYTVAIGLPAALTDGLFAHWKMDDGSGDTVSDSTANGFDGLRVGATWTSGAVGGALSFDGITNRVEVSSAASITGTGPFSACAWVKVPSAVEPQLVLQQRSDAEVNGEYILRITPTGQVYWSTFGDMAFGFNIYSVKTVDNDKWHHLAGVRESDGTGLLYIDGQLDSTDAQPARTLVPIAIYIGADMRGDKWFLNGKIDDVRVYNRALTQAEVQELVAMKESGGGGGGGGCSLADGGVDPLAWALPYLGLVLIWVTGRRAKSRSRSRTGHGE